MTVKDEYLGSILTTQELMNAGYSQKGYESILRLDTWIEQKCTQHTTTETVNIANVSIYVDSTTMKTSALRAFVNELDSRHIDEFTIHNNLRCDEDDYGYQNFVGYLTLSADETKQIDMPLSMYKIMYINYVHDVLSKNIIESDSYKAQREALKNEQKKEKDLGDFLMGIFLE